MFVAPAGNPDLASITFSIKNPSATAVPFQAYVYNWNGSAVIGPPVFASAPLSVAPSGGSFTNLTVSGMNAHVTPGNTYVVVYSTVGFKGPADSTAWQLSTQASYAPGKFVYNNSTTFSGLFAPASPPWNSFGNFGNLAFEMHFAQIGTASVPEPGALALLAGLSIPTLLLLRRRR